MTNRATELAGLSDAEINGRVVICLEWLYYPTRTGQPFWLLPDSSTRQQLPDWCTSYDAVHRDLLPEIERRRLFDDFTIAINEPDGLSDWEIVNLTPRQLTAAFVAVMEAANA